jgi:hypothetical protein
LQGGCRGLSRCALQLVEQQLGDVQACDEVAQGRRGPPGSGPTGPRLQRGRVQARGEKPDRQLYGAGDRLDVIGAAVGAQGPLTAPAAAWPAVALVWGGCVGCPSCGPPARRARRAGRSGDGSSSLATRGRPEGCSLPDAGLTLLAGVPQRNRPAPRCEPGQRPCGRCPAWRADLDSSAELAAERAKALRGEG